MKWFLHLVEVWCQHEDVWLIYHFQQEDETHASATRFSCLFRRYHGNKPVTFSGQCICQKNKQVYQYQQPSKIQNHQLLYQVLSCFCIFCLFCRKNTIPSLHYCYCLLKYIKYNIIMISIIMIINTLCICPYSPLATLVLVTLN